MAVDRSSPEPGCSTARNCSNNFGRSCSLPGFKRVVMSCAHIENPRSQTDAEPDCDNTRGSPGRAIEARDSQHRFRSPGRLELSLGPTPSGTGARSEARAVADESSVACCLPGDPGQTDLNGS